MKLLALSVLLLVAAISTPAKAHDEAVHGMNAYYGSADRDQINNQDIHLTRMDVKNIQKSLMHMGYKPGRVDGVYGRETTAAVKKFQHDRHLGGKGKMNALTMGALHVSAEHDFNHGLNRNYNN